eukprot:1005662-Karenia_brevis.AAC.1
MDVDSVVDKRNTTKKIDSTLDSLQVPGASRAKSRGREASRARGGAPQPKYSLEEALEPIRMSDESRGTLWKTCELCETRMQVAEVGNQKKFWSQSEY